MNRRSGIGWRIRRARESVTPRLSQETLAGLAGISRDWLRKIESGRHEPTAADVVALHGVLVERLPGLPWPWLMKGDGQLPGGHLDRYDGVQGGKDANRREALTVGLVLGAAAVGDSFIAALERLSRLGSQSVAMSVDGLEEMAADFAWSLTREPVATMHVRLNALFVTTQDLLDTGPSPSQRRRLQSIAGRCACLLAATLIDMKDFGAARANAILGLQFGVLADDAWVQGFAWLQRARTAEDSGRLDESVQLARQGLSVAPERTAVTARLLAVEPQLARLGRRDDAMAAINRLRSLFERLPDLEVSESAVGFTAERVERAVGQTLMYLGRFTEAEGHIRAAIPSPESATPSSLASMQLELSQILVGQGRPDEAIDLAKEALGTERLVANHLRRASQVESALTERYPGLKETRELSDRRATLALPAISTG